MKKQPRQEPGKKWKPQFTVTFNGGVTWYKTCTQIRKNVNGENVYCNGKLIDKRKTKKTLLNLRSQQI